MTYLIHQGKLEDPGELISFIEGELAKEVNGGVQVTQPMTDWPLELDEIIVQTRELVERVMLLEVREIEVTGVKLPPGAYADVHTHAMFKWIGMFYLTVGSAIVLEQPEGDRKVWPAPGRILLFPGRTVHRIERQDLGNRYAVRMAFR